jgi:hypothetical protein
MYDIESWKVHRLAILKSLSHVVKNGYVYFNLFFFAEECQSCEINMLLFVVYSEKRFSVA